MGNFLWIPTVSMCVLSIVAFIDGSSLVMAFFIWHYFLIWKKKMVTAVHVRSPFGSWHFWMKNGLYSLYKTNKICEFHYIQGWSLKELTIFLVESRKFQVRIRIFNYIYLKDVKFGINTNCTKEAILERIKMLGFILGWRLKQWLSSSSKGLIHF